MSGSLVLQIAFGIAAGIVLALLSPTAAKSAMLLGNLFVQALKAVAPVLVLVLVASAIANRSASHTAQLRPIVLMYLAGTFLAALLAVTVSTIFPTTLALQMSEVSISAPQGIAEVLGGLLQKLVDNPVNAVLNGNYIGILVWGILLGIFLHRAADSTRQMLADTAEAVTNIAGAPIARLSDIRLSANWMAAAGEPGQDATLFDTVQAVGMELCPELGINIPVGKDSMSMRTVWEENGEEKRVTAPLSLIVSAFASVRDVRKTWTPQLRTDQGDTVLLLVDLGMGANRLGGSALAQVYGALGKYVPDVVSTRMLRAFFMASFPASSA